MAVPQCTTQMMRLSKFDALFSKRQLTLYMLAYRPNQKNVSATRMY